MTRGPAHDLLDRRQRLAAAILLSAVDLPVEAGAWARLAINAAKACPGVNVQEACFGQGRRVALLRARDLVDELLVAVGVHPPRNAAQMPAKDLTDLELHAEAARVGAIWDGLPGEKDDDTGHAGSPGEWIVERLDEVNAEQQRRAVAGEAVA